jgi:hypothetical protein
VARFFHPLVHLLARPTHRELAQQIEFLKVENQILRSKLPKGIWTRWGRVYSYVLVFINLETRRVLASPATTHPEEVWVVQQAKNFTLHLDEQNWPISHLLHDWDTKFTQSFDAVMESEGAEVKRVGPQMPKVRVTDTDVHQWARSSLLGILARGIEIQPFLDSLVEFRQVAPVVLTGTVDVLFDSHKDGLEKRPGRCNRAIVVV